MLGALEVGIIALEEGLQEVYQIGDVLLGKSSIVEEGLCLGSIQS